jgi:transposase
MEAAGARLLYLPPYSPDLNPIEKAFAKLKQLLLPSVCLQARVIAFEIAQTEDRKCEKSGHSPTTVDLQSTSPERPST